MDLFDFIDTEEKVDVKEVEKKEIKETIEETAGSNQLSWETLAEKQPKVSRILKNSITGYRVSHGYLFKGGAGVGKKEVALHFIKRFFCSSPKNEEPCGTCSHCKRIDSGNHPDFHIIEPDGASIKIEQIRHLQKEYHWKSVEGDKKAYLIIDAEKMTTQSANGLLKFLEEPSQDSLAILTTTQPQQILTTIKSRCQEIAFQPLNATALVNELVGAGADKTLAIVTSQLTNDLTKAKELLEDEWFHEALNVALNLTKDIFSNSEDALFTIQREWINHFKEKEQQQLGLELLLLWYRDVQMYQLDRDIMFKSQMVQLEMQNYNLETLYDIMNEIITAKSKLYSNTNHQMVMEQLVHFIISKG